VKVAGGIVCAGGAYFLADSFLPSHLPVGIVLLGLVLGGLSALAALGMVLVYRAFRIVNFAQVAVGALGASCSVVLATGYHWPYIPAVLAGLVLTVIVGLVVDAVFEWRFAAAPRLIVTVATIGLLQIVGAAQIGLPHIVDHTLSPVATFTFPFHLSVTVNSTPFTANDVLALCVVPVVTVTLWWFFSKTDTGLAVRGAADSGERAQLLGIPVRRIHRVVWVLAAGLSGMGAVLAAPITQSTVGIASGPEDLLPALAAAVLARFESMPATVVWSLVLSVFEQAVYWSYHTYTYSDIALFALIVVGLLVRRAPATRSDVDRGLGDWVAVRDVRRIPAPLARLPEVRVTRMAGLAALVALAVLVPVFFSVAVVGPLAQAAVYAIVAVSLVVLTGWGGQISLGQFAFAGIGSAITGALLVHLGMDLFVALGLSAVAGAVVACAIGLPALRLPGLQLAVVTLAFAVVVSTWLLSTQYFPWLNPSVVAPPVLFGRFSLQSRPSLYELCLVMLLVALLLARNFRRSRAGRALLASRDGPRTAASFAVSPWRAQLTGFAFAGALCGMAGGLYVVAVGGTGFAGANPSLSVTVFAMAVIGGLGSLPGGLLGAAYVWAAVTWLPNGVAPLVTGAGLLVVLAVFPEGLAGILVAGRDRLLRAVAKRRGIPDPFAGVSPAGARAEAVAGGDDGGDGGAAGTGSGGRAAGGGRPAAPPLLGLDDLHVSIGSTPVLTGVDLGVPGGAVTALLGTNGAGKSTLLRSVSGLLGPRRGRITYKGEDITSWSTVDRVRAGLVMVPGGRGVFHSLTVAENLRLAGWTFRHHHGDRVGLEEAERRVVDLFPVLDRRRGVRAGNLSGGEQQMLALAQALMCRPTVLMIDELSLGLAPSVVAELLDVVRQLVTGGVTVIIVEQSVNVAAAVADGGVFLERGRVQFRGPVTDLLDRPDLMRSVFVAPVDTGHRSTGAGPGGPSAGPGDRTPAAPPATPPVLRLAGVTKRYGGVAALTDVDITVAPGEILGIIGANGAGKTSLLDVASGFLLPEEGRVEIDGREVTFRSATSRAAVGMGRTFQDARLLPALTVAEVVATAYDRHVAVRDPFLCTMWTYAVARSERDVGERAAELLDTLGLGALAERRIHELSTGTRRIVSLAAALAFAPRVLLLDEPTAGVAQREGEALVPFIRRLRDRTGAAFVVVDHDVPLLGSLVDRLVCMHLGEVIAEGAPGDVLADPQVMRAYLGDVPETVARSGPILAAGRNDD
jgi:ABC-type branched-subunit amino acid transport system ATPase component/branched-subunit amino acid ABC-type transport system permease component